MKRKFVVWMFVLCCILAAGCGREEKEDAPEEIVPTGEYAPVAEFTPVRVAMASFSQYTDCVWIGDEIFYLEREWNDGRRMNDSCLYAAPIDGKGEPRAVADNSGDDSYYIDRFFADGEGMLYLFEWNRDAGYTLRKIDADGNEFYRTDLSEAFPQRSRFFLSGYYVDGQGNIAMMDIYNNHVLFFDNQGRYRNTADMDLGATSDIHVVKIGESGYYVWNVDIFERTVHLQELDFEKGLVGEELTLDMSSLAGDGYLFQCVLIDGGELGLLASTKEVLWQYDIDTGEAVEYLRWDDGNINVDGRYVWQVRFGEMQEGMPAMDVLLYHERMYTSAEIASIRYIDKAYIKKRQTVKIGMDSDSLEYSRNGLDEFARKFNRLNNGYEVVFVGYEDDGLKEALLYGKEVPDLLDVSGMRTEWLESKNLLENLVPYFKKSGVMGKEDILPEVWEILEKNGKLTRMATGFSISSLITSAELPADGWTYEQFFALQEQYPDSWFFRTSYVSAVWWRISETATNEFIDWNKGRCSFDSEEFKWLLEKIKGIDCPDASQMPRSYTDIELVKDLVSRKYLFSGAYCGSPYDYDRQRTQSGGKVKYVGYPTVDGETAYLFKAAQEFAIYANSPCKDGAWAFIEYLLSEDAQNWYSMEKDVFPVRRSAFEEYLTRKPDAGARNWTDVVSSEETPDELRYMVSHLRQGQSFLDEVDAIISEEMEAYFAGDKTVEDTVKVIQNRVQLYLDEM